MALNLSQSKYLKQSAQLHAQIKISQLMQMSEAEFQDLINNIENNPLFKRLMYPKDKGKIKEKIISYRRFPGTRIAKNFSDFSPEQIKATGSPDLESLIKSKDKIMRTIKKIGSEDFKKYFLYSDFDIVLDDLSRRLSLSEDEIENIQLLINDLALKSRFYFPGSFESLGIKYQKIAEIEKDKGRFLISFLSLSLARGQYFFNQKKLDKLAGSGQLSRSELRKINFLINKLKAINLRKTTLFRIVSFIISKQKKFLNTSEPISLIPFSQKEAAANLGLSSSVFNRAIKYRSLDSPWGTELPLKYFFPSLKNIRIYFLDSIIKKNIKFKSDKELQEYLQSRHGIYISRRTVNKYKKEIIKHPSCRK
ncbi:MAG: hypothetical protein JW867_04360 [Candidatus Omnitrophica bacterium]|nr:hypothetical protein [Candidatus Omnitrophota bacterium]